MTTREVPAGGPLAPIASTAAMGKDAILAAPVSLAYKTARGQLFPGNC